MLVRLGCLTAFLSTDEGEEEKLRIGINTTCSLREWRSRRDGRKKENELGVHPTASAESVNPYAVMATYCLMTCSAPSTITICHIQYRSSKIIVKRGPILYDVLKGNHIISWMNYIFYTTSAAGPQNNSTHVLIELKRGLFGLSGFITHTPKVLFTLSVISRSSHVELTPLPLTNYMAAVMVSEDIKHHWICAMDADECKFFVCHILTPSGQMSGKISVMTTHHHCRDKMSLSAQPSSQLVDGYMSGVD